MVSSDFLELSDHNDVSKSGSGGGVGVGQWGHQGYPLPVVWREGFPGGIGIKAVMLFMALENQQLLCEWPTCSGAFSMSGISFRKDLKGCRLLDG